MKNHVANHTLWLQKQTQQKHWVLTTEEDQIVTVSIPLLEPVVNSWLGDKKEFLDKFIAIRNGA